MPHFSKEALIKNTLNEAAKAEAAKPKKYTEAAEISYIQFTAKKICINHFKYLHEKTSNEIFMEFITDIGMNKGVDAVNPLSFDLWQEAAAAIIEAVPAEAAEAVKEAEAAFMQHAKALKARRTAEEAAARHNAAEDTKAKAAKAAAAEEAARHAREEAAKAAEAYKFISYKDICNKVDLLLSHTMPYLRKREAWKKPLSIEEMITAEEAREAAAEEAAADWRYTSFIEAATKADYYERVKNARKAAAAFIDGKISFEKCEAAAAKAEAAEAVYHEAAEEAAAAKAEKEAIAAEEAAHKAAAAVILEVYKGLPTAQKEAFELIFVKGKSEREAAAAVGISGVAMHKRKKKIITALEAHEATLSHTRRTPEEAAKAREEAAVITKYRRSLEEAAEAATRRIINTAYAAALQPHAAAVEAAKAEEVRRKAAAKLNAAAIVTKGRIEAEAAILCKAWGIYTRRFTAYKYRFRTPHILTDIPPIYAAAASLREYAARHAACKYTPHYDTHAAFIAYLKHKAEVLNAAAACSYKLNINAAAHAAAVALEAAEAIYNGVEVGSTY